MTLLLDILMMGAAGAVLRDAPTVARQATKLVDSILTIDPATDIEVETVETIRAGKSEAETEVEFLVYRDGSLGFMLDITGSIALVGAAEREGMQVNLGKALKTIMEHDGISIQSVFQRDPAHAGRIARTLHKPMRDTAARLSLDLADMFEAKEKDFARRIEGEQHYWVVTIGPAVLARKIRSMAYKNRTAVMKTFPRAEDVQRLGVALEDLKNRAYGVLKTVTGGLGAARIDYRIVPASEAVSIMTGFVNPSLSSGMKAVLPSDPVPSRLHPEMLDAVVQGKPNPGTLLWPSLATQILREAPELPTPNTISIDGRTYALFSVRLLPTQIGEFQKLLSSLSNDGVPWRMSIRLSSNGPAVMGYRATVSQFLKFASSTNKQLHAAATRVKEYEIASMAQVKVQIDLATWAPVGDADTLMRRVESLVSTYQALGGAQIERQTNRAWRGFLETCPGLRLNSGANWSVIRLYDAIGLMPIGRPSSPWSNEPASLLFRYADGKVLPYDPNSSLLSAKVMVTSGPMGHGKSVMLMAYCMSLICAPGRTSWPYIAFFDIGPGSSGLISLLQSALPDDCKDYAQYINLDRDPKRYGINPFDTPLGYWYPTTTHRKFLVFLMGLIAPRAAEHEGFLDLLIEEAYKRQAPMVAGGTPLVYAPGFDADVDRLYDVYEAEMSEARLPSGVPWWSVVDVLFAHGHHGEATKAQRFAVPSLTAMAGLALDPELRKLYESVPGTSPDDKLPDYVNRCIVEATRLYPHLCGPSKISIGRSKIVAFNLDRVCPKGATVAARTETALSYMVARQLAAGAWKADFDELDSIREGRDPNGDTMPLVKEYRAYHRERIQSLKEEPKLFLFDEKHRTQGIPAIEKMIEEDYREGRKYRIYLGLASQSISDFEDTLLSLATSIFILGAGSVEGARKVSDLFEFNQTTREYVRDGLVKAGPQGANMIACYTTSRGRFVQHQYLSLGPVEMWAYQSNPDDAVLRNMLYGKLSPEVARNALAIRFPSGSAEVEIQRRRAALVGPTGAPDDEHMGVSIIRGLAEEIESEVMKHVGRAA